MAIEFKHNGRIWRADSAVEAIELRRCLEMEDEEAYSAGEVPDVVEEEVWTPDAAHELLKSSGTLQKNFLKFLYETGGLGNVRAESTDVIKALKLTSEEALAGVLSGLSKQLKKIGRQPSELYSVQVHWEKDGKTRKFRLTTGFRWAVTEIGWPDKWV